MTKHASELQFVRRLDGLTYRFVIERALSEGRPSYRRVDAPLWVRWTPLAGWACVDESGVANAWPLEASRSEASPPTGGWRSRKGLKSYLYDVVVP